MLQTLFIIDKDPWGVPLGVWVLGIWAVASVIGLAVITRKRGFGTALSESWLTIVISGAAAYILPNLMEPEGLPIRGYGVMLLLAVVSGVALSAYRAQHIGLDPELIYSLAMWLFVAGIVGARLFYVIEYWKDFQKPTMIDTLKAMASVTKGGLVVYGSLLAGGAALVAFVYKHKLPGLMVSDLIAPGVVLGMAIGRIGCFLNGCCYGGVCSLPWAVEFPAGSPPFIEQAAKGELFLHGLRIKSSRTEPAVIEAVEPDSPAARAGLQVGDRVVEINGHEISTAEQANFALLNTYHAGDTISIRTDGTSVARSWTIEPPLARSRPVHPAQLYSTIDALLLCFFLLAWDPYRQREGELTALTLTIHPISRFLLEIIRIDESAVFGTGLSISQNVSIGVFIGAIVCWIVVLSRPKGLWQPAGSK